MFSCADIVSICREIQIMDNLNISTEDYNAASEANSVCGKLSILYAALELELDSLISYLKSI